MFFSFTLIIIPAIFCKENASILGKSIRSYKAVIHLLFPSFSVLGSLAKKSAIFDNFVSVPLGKIPILDTFEKLIIYLVLGRVANCISETRMRMLGLAYR